MTTRDKSLQVAKGVATQIPGLLHLRDMVSRKGGAAADVDRIARYCYSVWLGHIVHAHANDLKVPPQTLLELGPGKTLGVGYAALLCGTQRYVALDAIASIDWAVSRLVLERLLDVLRRGLARDERQTQVLSHTAAALRVCPFTTDGRLRNLERDKGSS